MSLGDTETHVLVPMWSHLQDILRKERYGIAHIYSLLPFMFKKKKSKKYILLHNHMYIYKLFQERHSRNWQHWLLLGKGQLKVAGGRGFFIACFYTQNQLINLVANQV